MVEKAGEDAPDKIQMRYMVGGEMYLCTVMPHEEGKKLADLTEAGRQEVVDILVDNMEAVSYTHLPQVRQLRDRKRQWGAEPSGRRGGAARP